MKNPNIKKGKYSRTPGVHKVTFKVEEISGPENCLEIKMLGSNGAKLRFYPHPDNPWFFKTFLTGNITSKIATHIIDNWYVGKKSMNVKIGDFVEIFYKDKKV